MSKKRKRTLIRKRTSGKVTRLSDRQAHLSPYNPEQKLSELIKDMAWSLLKDPGRTRGSTVDDTALIR